MGYTFFILKPDCFANHLDKAVCDILTAVGFDLRRIYYDADPATRRPILEQHYAEHRDKEFYGALIEFMCSGPLMLIVAETRAPDAVLLGRMACEYIRKRYANPEVPRENVLHAADSADAVRREVKIWNVR